MGATACVLEHGGGKLGFGDEAIAILVKCGLHASDREEIVARRTSERSGEVATVAVVDSRDFVLHLVHGEISRDAQSVGRLAVVDLREGGRWRRRP